MKHRGKRIVWFALLLGLSLGVWTCGGSEEEAVGLNSAVKAVLGTGLEEANPAGLQDTEEEVGSALLPSVMEASGMKELAESEVSPSVLPAEAPAWWLLLHPVLRARARGELREILEAPGKLAVYIMTHQGSLPACVAVNQSPSCPLNPDQLADTCATTITFTEGDEPCQMVFVADGHSVPLNFSGSLQRVETVTQASSGPAIWDGKWTADNTATNFKVTDPVSAKFITYNGTLKGTIDGTLTAPPYDFYHKFEAELLSQVTLTDWWGNQFSSSGTREVWINPGNSVQQVINTYPTFTPAGGDPLRTHREVTRLLQLEGSTVHLQVTAKTTLIDLLRVWQHNGELTLERLNLTKVKVNGQSQIITPQGRTTTIKLKDVVQDLTHMTPISGTAVVSFPNGVVYTITFTGVCSLSWENNKDGSGKLNYCQWQSFQD